MKFKDDTNLNELAYDFLSFISKNNKTKRKRPLVKTYKGIKYTASYLPNGELVDIHLVGSKKQIAIWCLDIKSNNAKDYIDYFIENEMI